jgi:DNA-binding CsgD family transcriptional regulator
VLEASIDVVGADAGYIRLFELDETEPLTARFPFAAHRGISEHYLEYFGSLSQPVSNEARQAVYNGQRVLIEDLMSDPAFEPHRQVVAEEGLRTLMTTPLMSRNGTECVGAINTYFRTKQVPSPRATEILDLYAELAANTIERHQLIYQLARQTRTWGAVASGQSEILKWAVEQLQMLERSVDRMGTEEVKDSIHAIAGQASKILFERNTGGASLDTENPGSPVPYGLTQREIDVMINVWRELSEAEMAAEMGISRFTVAKYLGTAMRKLNVETRTEARELVGRDLLPGEAGRALEFSDLLRIFRRRAGLTQSELADRAGLSFRTISDLERGARKKAYSSTVALLSAALELDEADATRLAGSVVRTRTYALEREATSDGDGVHLPAGGPK